MRVGSLFAGIGGFDLGLERAGMRTVWQVEADPFCRRVLAQHFPDAERFDDVRWVTHKQLRRVDVICGGFPCQDLSLAGKGAGIDGGRSGLWSHFARIIGQLRPRYVIVENVPALLGRGAGRVLGDLAARGYDAEWDCLPASAFGAPHQRDRFWLVAYPQCDQLREQPGRGSGKSRPGSPLVAVDGEAQSLADAAGDGCGQGRPGRLAGESANGQDLSPQGMADPQCPGLEGLGLQPGQSQVAQSWDEGWWATEPDVGRVANGVPARVDRLRSLGNALVPQIAEWIGRRLMDYEAQADAA